MAGKLSDRELRRQALKLRDPYEQSKHLVWDIPDDVALVDILNLYTYKEWPLKKVYCVECGGHHHKNGFTALLTNGKRALLGSRCGAKLFGESWQQAEKRIKERSDRQWELDRIDRLETILDPLRSSLLLWEAQVQKLMYRLEGFQSALGELSSRLLEATNHHQGALTVGRRIEMKSTKEVGPKGWKQTDFVHTKVADMIGSDLFLREDPCNDIKSTLDAISAIKPSMAGTDSIRTSTLKSQRQRLERALEKLETVHRIYRGGQEFFTEESFVTLVWWTNRYNVTRHQYEFAENGIRYSDGRSGVRLPDEPLPDLDSLPLDLIQEYRRAD